jgi:alkanesulfonate monooxygenase SsuD/methylene tetrahydromethanopterin reductase-like flavin-dependent oxidoreductase (luciferase family)
MKFGFMQMAHCRPRDSAAAALDRFVSTAVEAERLGYWSCWTTEHHFGSNPEYRPFGVPEDEYDMADYDMVADPLTLFTYVAAKTERLRLGTGVVVVHWDHPIRIAERAAMLDLLSGGRLELGIGRGAGFREVGVFKVPTDGDESRR